MGIINRLTFLAMLVLFCGTVEAQPAGRNIQNFNFDWKFFRGDMPEGQSPALDDAGWRNIDLPHDWSIEGPFSRDNSSCTGYLPGGIGWYRKTFTMPAYEKGRKVFIYFDGVYNNSEVWINGKYLGKRPNGYISFQYDLTPYLNFGKENFIAVKVDHTLDADSRWYTGSGIYRDVKLISTEPVHLKEWGIFCRTSDVSASGARLQADITVMNETGHNANIKVTSTLMYGNEVIGQVTDKISFKSSPEKTVTQAFNVSDPELWDVENPNLYSLVTEVKGRELLDKTVTHVGFRDLKFDPDRGFFLNGKSMKLKGICMHHDAGTLGSAVAAEEFARRLIYSKRWDAMRSARVIILFLSISSICATGKDSL